MKTMGTLVCLISIALVGCRSVAPIEHPPCRPAGAPACIDQVAPAGEVAPARPATDGARAAQPGRMESICDGFMRLIDGLSGVGNQGAAACREVQTLAGASDDLRLTMEPYVSRSRGTGLPRGGERAGR